MFKDFLPMIYSQDPDSLVKFYTDVLGFEVVKEFKHPEDYGYKLKMIDDKFLFIGRHSKVNGLNQNPDRNMYTLYTDEVGKWYEKIRTVPGIKIVLAPSPLPIETDDRTVCTFLDPDGNCWQFLGKM